MLNDYLFKSSIPKLGEDSVIILEGDKLAALYALFLRTVFKIIIEDQKLLSNILMLTEDFSKWKVGVARTAYGNGASLSFLQDKLNVKWNLILVCCEY